MSFAVREGVFDVAIVEGPRVGVWPSVGARTLSALCAEMGLTVGVFGEPGLQVTGVIPLPGSGGTVLAQDPQGRVHRITARAVVKFASTVSFPGPFPGWRSDGLVPLRTAEQLLKESKVPWGPATVILGTGNGALRFGSHLLESGLSPRVACVETVGKWGSKDYAGWEVERRRFETLGGRIIQGQPTRLDRKAPMLWEFRLQDAKGVRILEVGRVVSAGPFQSHPGVREYPPGSCLYEVEQSAPANRAEDVESWSLEEERGRWLGGRLARTLVPDLGDKKELLDKAYRRARARLKTYVDHYTHPHEPPYQGKWLEKESLDRIRAFEGVPKHAHKVRQVASLECFENIPCNLCEKSCPESAIQIRREQDGKASFLIESDCTACGLCLTACPSTAAVMLQERDAAASLVTLPWRGHGEWKQGELATLVNRKGEKLGSGRVVGMPAVAGAETSVKLVQVEVPSHLVWQARGLRRQRPGEDMDEAVLASPAAEAEAASRVEILLDGEKRLAREGVPLAIALFELGRSRPQDVLYCPDGSCGLCDVTVDGVRQKACRLKVRRGMAVRSEPKASLRAAEPPSDSLCPCLAVQKDQIIERIRQGKLSSPEAVLAVTRVGEGRCHGQLCVESLRRIMEESGIGASEWVDWRFPWSDWVLPSSKLHP